MYSCNAFALSILFQYAAQSASNPAILLGEALAVGMLEVFEPASLDRSDPFDYSLEAVSISASGVLSDIVSELLDTLVRRELHPLLEFVSQKLEDFFVGIDDFGLGRMQD